MSSAIQPSGLAENPQPQLRLLVVSQEPAVVRPLAGLGERCGWRVEVASSAWDAMERLESGAAPRLLLLDLPGGEGDSLHLLRWLRRFDPRLAAVVLCPAEDVRLRQEAVRLGADRILARPVDAEQVQSMLRSYGDSAELETAETGSAQVARLGRDAFFVSASPLMQKLRAQAELLAQSDVPVLLVGERGSGKAALARLLHQLSVRSGFPLYQVNCAALPEDLLQEQWFAAGRMFGAGSPAGGAARGPRGSLERGERGTVFFAEIAALPAGLQALLLEALYRFEAGKNTGLRSLHAEPAKPAEIRILSSTSAHPERALAEHRLNPDLYRRLSAFTLQVPALRERREEIPILLRYAMRKLASHYGLAAREFSPALLEACQQYGWPGNLTELENFVKRYLAGGEPQVPAIGVSWGLGGASSEGHLLPHGESGREPAAAPGVRENGGQPETAAAAPRSLKSLIQDVKCDAERKAIGAALERTGWNRKAAARLLRVSYRTLLYKIEQYRMKAADPLFPAAPLESLAAGENGGKPDGKAG